MPADQQPSGYYKVMKWVIRRWERFGAKHKVGFALQFLSEQ